MSDKTKIVIIYHKNCVDGMAAAWVANKFFEGDVILIAAEYHKRHELVNVEKGTLDSRLEGADVYVLDFSFERDETLRLQQVANKVVVLDHHATSCKALEGLYTVDTTKCGAVLAWEYFFGSNEMPEAFKLIQDNDLGIWEDPRTLPWIMGLQGTKLTLEHFDMFMEMGIEHGVALGTPIYKYHMKNVRNIKRSARNFNLDEFKGVIVNANSHYRNELGVELCKEHLFAAIYWETETHRVFSLRGKDKRINLAAVAERFGGGGHEDAAAFSISLNDPRMNTAHYLLQSIRTSKEED